MDLHVLNEEVKFPNATGISVSQNIELLGKKNFLVSVLRYQIFEENNSFFYLYLDINQGVIYLLNKSNKLIDDYNEKIKKIFGEDIKFTDKTVNHPKGNSKIVAKKWPSGKYKDLQKKLSEYFKTINTQTATQPAQDTTQTDAKNTNTNNTPDNSIQNVPTKLDEIKQKFNIKEDESFKKIISTLETNKSKIDLEDSQKENLKILINYLLNDDVRNLLFMKLKISKNKTLSMIQTELKKKKDKTPEEEKQFEIIDAIFDLILEINISVANKLSVWKVIKDEIADLKYFYESTNDKEFYKEIKNVDLFLEKYLRNYR